MSHEAIQRESRGTRSLGQTEDKHSDIGRGGDQQGNELKKRCVFALAILICIPLLTLFAFLAMVMTLARVIPEITDYILE